MAAASTTITIMGEMGTTMPEETFRLQPLAFLRLQNWLSPIFPTGAYSYSHAVECAVETGHIHDRISLVDWLAADLRYGSGRNEAIFFSAAWSSAANDDRLQLLEVAELAAAFRGTAEFALESAQQGSACRATLSQVWRDPLLDWLWESLSERSVTSAVAVVLGIRCARQGVPIVIALPAFLQAYVANLVNAGLRLVPLGQTDGQFAIAALEDAVLATSASATSASLGDLGSAGFMVDLASMAHESQYTRLFRS